jgi:hypothetical protein
MCGRSAQSLQPPAVQHAVRATLRSAAATSTSTVGGGSCLPSKAAVGGGVAAIGPADSADLPWEQQDKYQPSPNAAPGSWGVVSHPLLAGRACTPGFPSHPPPLIVIFRIDVLCEGLEVWRSRSAAKPFGLSGRCAWRA